MKKIMLDDELSALARNLAVQMGLSEKALIAQALTHSKLRFEADAGRTKAHPVGRPVGVEISSDRQILSVASYDMWGYP